MLKRLELVGFKSFADKTQFDFAAGITAVVGPNGSGKSNIVDAVRWVLGEQSAKSLRGGEMADVIFNGSTSRRSLGLAEVTMTFDNSRRLLTTDADEVQISRRVYRDGQGEYLINQQPSRLRDIKDLFLGSGAGADAYCIIEQGRVDVLLQASTKERRTNFEEAAGISRFKAKKIESLRKLEHVDQNLQRLQDIIDEVDKQLRSVKLQATKAQRYQEYSERLKQLRLGLGLREYEELSQTLQTETATLETLRASLAEQSAQAEAWESQVRELEELIDSLDKAIHEQENLLATARRQITADETAIGHEWSLTADLQADLAQSRTQLTEINVRVATLAELRQQAERELLDTDSQCLEQGRGVEILEGEVQSAATRVHELQAQIHHDKAEHLELMRRSAMLQNDAISFKAQIDNLRRERDRLQLKTSQATEHLASLDLELRELSDAEGTLQQRLSAARQALAELREERERLRQLADARNTQLADLRANRSGLTSRIEVLEGLERSHEGLGTGVREVLALVLQAAPGPWQTVLGMVADFLTVPREYAALVDLALGERAQHFLVRDMAQLAEALRARAKPLAGRVSFVPIESNPASGGPEPSHSMGFSGSLHPPLAGPGENGASLAGVIGSAARVVACESPELVGLADRLFGRTLIVRDLDVARSRSASLEGYRFVTLAGELLESDGTLTAGTHHAETGILSRKSELRELRDQAAALEQQIQATEEELAALRRRIAALDGQAEQAATEIDVWAEQAADLRSRIGQHRQRWQGLREEVQLNRGELSNVEQDSARLEESWKAAQVQAAEAEQSVRAIQNRMEEADGEVRQREQHRLARQQECTAAQVALAQVRERAAARRARYTQIEADLSQRRLEQDQEARRLNELRGRLEQSQQTMLGASSSLAQAYLDKETAERRLEDRVRQREARRHERQSLAERTHSARSAWREHQEQAHARELQVNDLRHRRDALVARLREDYQIGFQLSALGPRPEVIGPDGQPVVVEPIADSRMPDAEEEIAELRRKLSRLGSVNLEALQELAELQARADSQQAQFKDLTEAKRSLEEIIAKINQDRRRLFTETLAAIRSHFQDLFRKLFGGGMADIVLEDESDILECGIEIIARPPGKELRSISLLSGGEKTLTAVALLLAIFRSKPSPFCILDEVDAALDEANIGRFTVVLREFLDRSHFIIITHSKRTMAAADVLYGITMQESGVSKRVAVRFEDWPEDEQNTQESSTSQVA